MPHEIDRVEPDDRPEAPIERIRRDRKRPVHRPSHLRRPIGRDEGTPDRARGPQQRVVVDDRDVVPGPAVRERAQVDKDGADRHGQVETFGAGIAKQAHG